MFQYVAPVAESTASFEVLESGTARRHLRRFLDANAEALASAPVNFTPPETANASSVSSIVSLNLFDATTPISSQDPSKSQSEDLEKMHGRNNGIFTSLVVISLSCLRSGCRRY